MGMNLVILILCLDTLLTACNWKHEEWVGKQLVPRIPANLPWRSFEENLQPIALPFVLETCTKSIHNKQLGTSFPVLELHVYIPPHETKPTQVQKSMYSEEWSTAPPWQLTLDGNIWDMVGVVSPMRSPSSSIQGVEEWGWCYSYSSIVVWCELTSTFSMTL